MRQWRYESLPASKRTALYAMHKALGARLIPFSGWEMPVEYSGISKEHTAVRTAAGLFDVSHMGEFEIRGPEALDLIQYVTAKDFEWINSHNRLDASVENVSDEITLLALQGPKAAAILQPLADTPLGKV